MCGTPGPNNIMLTASGANFGFKRTIPHIVGVEIGMICLFTSGAFGVGLLFEYLPFLHGLLKVLGSAYLLYLSWRIMMVQRAEESESKGAPLTTIEAAAFQFVNPKGLIITITTMSTYTTLGDTYASSVIRLLLVFGVVALFTSSIWAGFGMVIGSFLKQDWLFRLFNLFMGGLLALSVLYILY
jgi:threonine/homoserine/homoserine lactone efflux protein